MFNLYLLGHQHLSASWLSLIRWNWIVTNYSSKVRTTVTSSPHRLLLTPCGIYPQKYIMIMSDIHRHHIREGNSIMRALKLGSVEPISCCVLASLHIFTTNYAFPYVEAQNRVSAKNTHSCPFPSVPDDVREGNGQTWMLTSTIRPPINQYIEYPIDPPALLNTYRLFYFKTSTGRIMDFP